MATDPNELTPQERKAQEKSMQNLSADAQKILKAVLGTVEGQRAMADYSQDFAGHMQNASEYLDEYQKDLKKSLGMYKELKDVLRDTLDEEYEFVEGTMRLGKNLSNNVKIQRDFGSLLADESQVMDDLVLKQAMLGTGLQDDYAQVLATYMIENDIQDLNSEKLDNLKADLKKRQEIKHQLDKQLELVEGLATFQLGVREETEKLRSEYTLLGAKMRAIFGNKELGVAFVKALALDQTKKKFLELNDTFDEFRKEGLTVTTALKETGIAVGATFSLSGASIKENAELMSGFASSMGDTTKFSKDTVVEVGQLAKTLGLGMKEAGELQGQLQNMAGATAESATSTMEFAGALAIAAHVAPGAVMKDMAANAEDIAANTKNGGKDMALVSVAAHKLGVEMSSLTKMSAGLLDFENSINKQMEASVLLGRELNLDKAREAALNGDILGATKEMLQNVGGEAEFNKMNVVQRKALAEAMGVSVQDLSKMVKNQDQLANLTEEQQTALAEGVPLSDVLAANSLGVAKNFLSSAASIGGSVVGVIEMTKGLKEGYDMTKNMVSGFKEGTGFLGKMKGLFGGINKKAPETPPITPPGTTPGGEGAGQGAGKGLSGLASGLTDMGTVKVLFGIGNLALFGLAGVVAFAAVPFMLFIMLGEFIGEGLFGLAVGLEGMGNPAVALGNTNLMQFALAGVVGLVAIPFMIGVAMFGWLAGKGLKGLSSGLAAMGNPAVAAGVGVLELLVLSVGSGMLMFGIGVGVAAAGLSLLVLSLKDIPFRNLMALPLAMVGVGAGLYMMGAAGTVAIPTILALVALATVAPALISLGTALGGMFGGGGSGGGSGEKKDTIADVIAAIDRLATVITTKKGDVIMNGTKVGDVLLPIIENKLNHKSN